GAVVLLGGAHLLGAGQRAQARMAGFEPHLVEDGNAMRLIEGADGHRDVRAAQRAEIERRAAIAAEAACRDVGAVELGRRATGPGQVLVADADEVGEHVAARLLAHAAMAEMRIVAQLGGVPAHGAALAAAGIRAETVGIVAHASPPWRGDHATVSWSGCW